MTAQITTRTTGPVGTHTHVEVAHVLDTTPGDEYETVNLTIGERDMDLHPEDAAALHAALGSILTT